MAPPKLSLPLSVFESAVPLKKNKGTPSCLVVYDNQNPSDNLRIRSIVRVQRDNDPEWITKATSFLEEDAIVPYAPICDTEFKNNVENLCSKSDRVRAVTCDFLDASRLSDPVCRQNLEWLAERGIALETRTYSVNIELAMSVFGSASTARIILNPEEIGEELTPLALLPNVYIKLDNAQPDLKKLDPIVSAFGVERILCTLNWLPCLVRLGLDDEALDCLFYKTPKKCYNF